MHHANGAGLILVLFVVAVAVVAVLADRKAEK
jgi:hypothetical protein